MSLNTRSNWTTTIYQATSTTYKQADQCTQLQQLQQAAYDIGKDATQLLDYIEKKVYITL